MGRSVTYHLIKWLNLASIIVIQPGIMCLLITMQYKGYCIIGEDSQPKMFIYI